MQEQLWKIFDNINFWLNYAERKNSLLLTVIGLQITAINLFSSEIDWILKVSLALLFLGFLVTLFSFFPRTRTQILNHSSKRKPIGPLDNLLFYDDIAKYSLDEYFVEIGKCFGEQTDDKVYLRNLCSQIITNSRIVSFKFKIFKLTGWLIILGQGVFFLSMVI